MILFIKKRIWLSTGIALGVIIVIFFIFSGDDDTTIDFITVSRQDLVQEVSVTGRVLPSQSANLAFQNNGKVSLVLIDIGDRVFAGQTLVRLQSNDIAAALFQTEAKVKIEQAKLDELTRGSTPEEIRVQEVEIENAERTLAEEKRNLVNTLQDAYTKSDDVVRNKVDQFITSPESSSPHIDFTLTDPQLKTVIEAARVELSFVLPSWLIAVTNLGAQSDLSVATAVAKGNLNKVKVFVDNVSLAVNSLKTNSTLSQTTIDAYRADVAAARTNVNTALSNVIAAEKKVRDAESKVFLEEEELVLKLAGTRSEQLEAQKAKVEEAQGAVLQKKAELAKTTLTSPFAGIVTVQNAKVGEIVSANTVVVSLISDAQFEIKANIPEADVAKVFVGNKARVTLDAYGSDVLFLTRVTAIDPAETIVEGVATYITTFQFDNKDERVRSGMTANIDIATGSRVNVIAIPARAVIAKDGKKIVRVLRSGTVVEEISVSTGLRGSDGNIEITEGINEGDNVILFIEDK